MLHRFPFRSMLPVAFCLLGSAHVANGWDGRSIGVIENRGQISESVRYYAHGRGASLYFTESAVLLDLPEQGYAIRMQFEGTSPFARLEPIGKRETQLHYFLGADPARWQSGIRPCDELIYRGLWPGIDLCFRPQAGELQYQVVRGPDADPENPRFRFEGVDRIETMDDGAIRLEIPSGVLFDLPVTPDGTKRVLRWNDRPAPIDRLPQDRDDPSSVLWSTLLGGTDNEYAHGLTLDGDGNPVVTGYTRSGNFPTTPGAYDRTKHGSYDVFVAKLHHTGASLIWATFLGGDEEDRSFGVRLDASGQPTVAGLSYSPGFPTTPGVHDRVLGGGRDAFVAKLSSSGSQLLWSTYLGGSSFDRIYDVVLDEEDRPIVVGETFSSDFPTSVGAFDTSFGAPADGFVTKLDAMGENLIWSTYLGGSLGDQTTFVALGPEQRPVVTGNTASSDYPTTPGAFDDTHNGGQDSFVTSLDSSGGMLYSSTYLGGEGSEYGNVIAVDATTGAAVVTGSTTSGNYPVTTGAYDTTHNGDRDLFVSRVDAEGENLIWSTYLGGISTDEPFALILDSQGGPILSGSTASSEFPTTSDAFDRSYAGNGDVFLTRLDSSGSVLLWSSFIGGTEPDAGWELALDSSGNPILTGPTRSPDFPTTAGAYDRSHDGANDVFLIRFNIFDVNAVEEPAVFLPNSWAEPNPFRGAVRLHLDLPRASEVVVSALDLTGRRIATVDRGVRSEGTHRIYWDGRDARGRPVPSGVYWIRVVADRLITQHRVICIR